MKQQLLRSAFRVGFRALVISASALVLAETTHAFDNPVCVGTPKFPDALGQHRVEKETWGFGSGGSLFGSDGASAKIWPEHGAILHNSMAGDEQVYLWPPGGLEQPITEEGLNHGEDALALAGDLIVYDKHDMPGLYYWDLESNREHLLTDAGDVCEFARTDGGGIVWVGQDPDPTISYAFPDCGDGVEDPGEQCDDGNTEAGDCCSPICHLEQLGTACGDLSDTACTDPDTCDGSGLCLANDASLGAACGDQGVDCLQNDSCDGAGSCLDNGFSEIDSACGDSSDTECSGPDTCDTGGSCLPNHVSPGAVCGSQGVECRQDGSCSLVGTCLDSGFVGDGAVCSDGNQQTLNDQCSAGVCEGVDPDLDSDNDGFPDIVESDLGTDPLDAASRPPADENSFAALGGYPAYLAHPNNRGLLAVGICDEESAFAHWRDWGYDEGRGFDDGQLRSDLSDGSHDPRYDIDGGFSWEYQDGKTVVFITSDAPKPDGWAGRELLLERCQSFNLGLRYTAEVYAILNGDVDNAISSGLFPSFASVTDHYVKYGFKEGRFTNGDWTQEEKDAWSDAAYFNANPGNKPVENYFLGAQSEGWNLLGKVGFAHWLNFGRDEGRDSGQPPVPDEYSTIAATFSVRESVEQLHITGATFATDLVVIDGNGQEVATGTVDSLGSLIFRTLAPGDGYRVREASGSEREESEPLRVMDVAGSQPPPEYYTDHPELVPGYNYIRTRDGTTLSAYVFLPGPAEEGPYPVIVGYSGYEPSAPGGPYPLGSFEEQREFLCTIMSVLCDAPNHPAGLIGGIFGFASVGVNMRGTGCSGGAYDYFETLQVLDGYDLIEVIAAQPWVAHGKVGMAGLSYPGITQLFTAQTQPPSLAAISPLSVIADTASSTLAPGGLFNNGFALQWAENVYNKAQPYGQSWSYTQIEVEAEAGETTCDDNQQLHGQAVDAVEKALQYPYYDSEVADPLNPSLFVDQIEVPVFLSGAWQDEQTGGHFAALLDKFDHAPARRFTVFNGLHADGYVPQVLAEWISFQDIYVSREVPYIDPTVANISALLFESFLGVAIPLPTLPFSEADIPGITYEEAKAGFEAQDPLRVIFENGAAQFLIDSDNVGAPAGAFEHTFGQWPPQETTPFRLYFNADGSLRPTPPEEDESASSFLHDASAGQRVFGGGQPFYEWVPTAPDSAAVFVSDPLSEDTVMLGHGSVDLYLQSDSEEAELEVLLSEVRPDGDETYVQAGWLRATHRQLSSEATELRPIKTHLEQDASPLPAGEWEEVRVEIFPFSHVFRAGSRIRIQVDTPGDARELWKFILDENEGVIRHQISHSASHPSSIVLPVIPGIVVPTPLPPCPSLRGQPCRTWDPGYINTLVEP